MVGAGINPIAIPSSDEVLAAYGGTMICVITWSVAGSASLILYDNSSTASGNILAVVGHGTASGTLQVWTKSVQGIYIKNTSGWTGTIWTG